MAGSDVSRRVRPGTVRQDPTPNPPSTEVKQSPKRITERSSNTELVLVRPLRCYGARFQIELPLVTPSITWTSTTSMCGRIRFRTYRRNNSRNPLRLRLVHANTPRKAAVCKRMIDAPEAMFK